MFPFINLLVHCFAEQTYQPCFLETVLSSEDMVICRCKLRGPNTISLLSNLDTKIIKTSRSAACVQSHFLPFLMKIRV